MSRRNAGEAGEQARQARSRLQATLGDNSRGLLLGDDGGPPFEYRGPGMAGGEKRGLLESSPTFDDGLRYTKYGALYAVTEFHEGNTRSNEGDDGRKAHDERPVRMAKQAADKTFAYLA